MFDAPLVGAARADDHFFLKLQDRSVVRSDHCLPRDFLEGAQSVISFFAPFSPQVSESNRAGGVPSEPWIYSRFYGQLFIQRLSVILKEYLQSRGFQAVVPPECPGYGVKDMNSNWSERHVAHVAGLGTFGLNAALITEKGVSGRFGSVVTTAPVQPRGRPYYSAFEYCPWYSSGNCSQCLDRCPAGALTAGGKDRSKCSQHLKDANGPSVRSRYGFPYSPCGKCYVDVACENRKPSRG